MSRNRWNRPSKYLHDRFSARRNRLRSQFGPRFEGLEERCLLTITGPLTIAGSASVNEGSPYTLNLDTSNQGSPIQSWSINWGDGSPAEQVAGTATSATHVYADGTRNFTVLATATDEDGTYLASAAGSNAQASLDPSFGTAGEVKVNLNGDTSDYVQAQPLILPDGKVLVAGYTSGGTTRLALARYLKANGALDPTFGDGGTVITEFDTYAYGRSLALDGNGDILVAGNFGIARYSPNGVLDTSFGNGGRLTSFTGISKMLVDSSGRIVVGNGYQFARFLASGAIDIDFGQGQSGVTPYLGYSYNDFTLTPAGKIVTVQNRYNGNVADQYDVIVRQHLDSGALDSTFGVGGVFVFDDGGFSAYAVQVAVQQNKVLVGGYLERLSPSPTNPGSFQSNSRDIVLFRLAADGQALDPSFGASGTVLYRYNAAQNNQYDYFYGMGVDSAGRVVVGGSYGQYRFSAAGQLDGGFGASGLSSRTVYPYSGGGYAFGGDGEIYLGGYSYYGSQGANFAVQRWHGDGTPDNAFNGGVSGATYVQTAFTGPLSDAFRQVTVRQADGKVLVVGQSSGGGTEVVLARYLADGTPDPAFGGGTGIVRTGVSGGVNAAAAAADGSVYVSTGYYLYRFLPSGVLDVSAPANGFGASGQKYADGLYVQSLALDGSGHLFAGGYRYQPLRNPDGSLDTSSYSYDVVVARYSDDGVQDSTYGNAGFATLDLDNSVTVRGDQFMNSMALDAAGRAVVVGYSYAIDRSTNQYNGQQAIVARFKTDGSGLDTTFNPAGGGVIRTNGADNSTYARVVTVDGSGKVLVGYSTALHRFNDDGSPDLTFNGTGYAFSSYSSIQAIRADAQGRVVVGGYSYLTRFNQNGTADTSFGPGGQVYIPNRVVNSFTFDAGGRVVAAGYVYGDPSTGDDYWLARIITGGLAVTVNNVAPQNLAISGPTSAVEGSTISLTASATDPAGANDPLVYTWNVYRNGTLYLQASGASITVPATDNGTYLAYVFVSDGDGGYAYSYKYIDVANVAPTAALNAPESGAEGTALTVSLTGATDASSNDTSAGFTYAFDFGGGYGIGSTSNSATFTPADGGPLAVKAKVRDKDGGEREYTATIDVANVKPVAAISGAVEGTEGTAVTLTSTVTDAGAADVTAGFTYAWTVTRSRDAGATWQPYASGTAPSFVLSPDNDGVYRVTLVATDKDGASSDPVTHDVSVTDVSVSNLVLTRSAAQIDENGTWTLSGTFDDPGEGDAHTVVIGWGDGSTDTVLNLAAGVLTFSADHPYLDNLPGPGAPAYTVTAKVTDSSQAGLARSLFIGGPNSVVQSGLDATSIATTVGSAGFVRDVEVDAVGGKIYWGDASNPGGSNKLYRANLDGSGRELLATVDSGIGGVGLDLAAGKVYFGSITRLYQANLDGSGLIQLRTGYLFNDVEVSGGKVYWTDVYGVKRANLDGTGLETVVSGQQSIVGLDVAGALGSIFWADQSSGLVQEAALDGSGVTTIATAQWGARGVVVDSESGIVYWGRGDSLLSQGLDGSNFHNYGSVGVDILALEIAGGATSAGVSAQTTVQVLNVAPTPAITAPATGVEGTAIEVGASATDPSTVDAAAGFSYDWAVYKDGGATAYDSGAGASWSIIPDDDGSYRIVLTATDKDGDSASVERTTIVTNVSPTATFANNGPINYGQTATVSFTTQHDESSVDMTAGFHYAYSLTADFTGITYADGGSSGTFDYSGLNAGDHTIYARIIDQDDGFTTYHTVVTVKPAALLITAHDAAKTYDGLAFSGGAGVGYDGLVDGEAPSVLGGALSYTGSSQGAVNVGSYIITPGGLTSSNYAISYADGALTVAPKTLTASLIGDPTKTYDANTDATLTSANYNLIGLVNGEAFTVTKATGAFNSANVATANTVTTSLTAGDFTPVGAALASNYTFPTSASGAGHITKADATISVTPYSVTYDANAHTATGTAKGVLNEALSGLNLAGTTHTNAGSYTDYWIFTDVTGNYNDAAGGISDFIGKAVLTITATTETKTYDGTTASSAVPTVDGLRSGDSVTGLDQEFVSKNVLGAGGSTLRVTAYAVADGNAGGNYSVSLIDAAGTITPAALIVKAVPKSKTYGAANPTLTYTYSGLVNGDTASVFSGGLATTATQTSPVGVYPIARGTLSAENYAISFTPSVLTVVLASGSVYVLDASASGALTLSGNANLSVDGVLVVDSNNASAVKASGNAVVTAAGGFQVVGGVSTSGKASVLAPTGQPGATGDPLAALAPPTKGTVLPAVNVSGRTSLTINPGTYSSIRVSGQASLTLNPGVYYIAGGGVSVTGSGSLSGDGVMIYNGGGSGGSYGGIALSGDGTVSLTAPSSGAYAGILIFQDRDNTRAMSLSGSSALSNIRGAIYAPNALLTLSGNGRMHGPIVVDTLTLSGNGSVTQPADGSQTLGDDSWLAGELLGADLFVYVDDADGRFSPDELARIQDAVNGVDALLAPYSVTVRLVADGAFANVVITTAATSASGVAVDGVLGSTTAAGEITILRGWNWYAGADPAMIGGDQFDFQTVVTHELGHALGLAHSAEADSVMNAVLAAGQTRRALTVADLNIDGAGDGGPHALHAQVNFPTIGRAVAVDSPTFTALGFAPTTPASNPVALTQNRGRSAARFPASLLERPTTVAGRGVAPQIRIGKSQQNLEPATRPADLARETVLNELAVGLLQVMKPATTAHRRV